MIPTRSSQLPDFLTPPGLADLDTAIDRVLSTPREQLSTELKPLLEAGLVPTRVGPLCDGELTALHELGEAMRQYHAEFIAPLWAEITVLVDADRAYRTHQLTTGGMQRLLDNIIPGVSWDSGTLSFDCDDPTPVDLPLEGRGLVLQPSVFAAESALIIPEQGPVVQLYPALLDHGAPPPGDSLAVLLGRTRATVLAAVPPSASTTQLACRVGISVASASEHATVLRGAGLIATTRTGPAVQHTLTPLGHELLGAGSPQSHSAP